MRAASDAGDVEALHAALGPYQVATLTDDGRQAVTRGWCSCGRSGNAATWARYERWTEKGLDGHGYVCRNCRYLTQTG